MKRLLFMLSILLTQLLSAQQQQQLNLKPIDSLLNLVAKTKDEKLQVIYHSQLANKYYLGGDLENAEIYAKKGLKIAEKINYKKSIGPYHICLAEINVIKENYDKAMHHAEIASRESWKANDKKNFLTAEYLVGYVYGILGQTEKEISRLENALKMTKNDKAYLDKGKIYFELSDKHTIKNKNLSKAINYLQKALESFTKAKFAQGVSGCYFNIVEIYGQTNDWKLAKKYCLLHMETFKFPEYYSNYYYSFALTKMGVIEMNLGNLTSALAYAKKAEKFNQQHPEEIFDNMPKNYMALADIYIAKKQPKNSNAALMSAMKYKDQMDIPSKIELYNLLQESYQQLNDDKNVALYGNMLASAVNEYEKETGEAINNIEIYKGLAQASHHSGDYKKAFEYYEKYAKLYEENSQNDKDNKISELQARFELTDKDLKLKDFTIEKQKSNLQLASQKNALLLTVGGLIIFLLIIAVLFWRYRINKKNNQVLAVKNNDLEVSQDALRQSMGEKDLLLKEIHHRVKNNLQLVISLLNIQARENNTAEVEDFLEKGRGRIVSMALIHQNLYQADNLAKVDFQEYLENLANASLESFQSDDVEVTFNIDAKDIYFDIQTSIPLGLIINELICNTMKHAFDAGNNGIIKIAVTQNPDGSFDLAFSDNGKGIDNESANQESFGIELVKLLAMQLGGELIGADDKSAAYTLTFEDRMVA